MQVDKWFGLCYTYTVIHKYNSNEVVQMGFQENVPIYVQIADDIKQEIISGDLHAGDKLLSIRECSAKYQVTALTVQRAMALLEVQQIVTAKKGVGSFVNPDAPAHLQEEMVKSEVEGFLKRMKKMGFDEEEILQKVKDGLSYE